MVEGSSGRLVMHQKYTVMRGILYFQFYLLFLGNFTNIFFFFLNSTFFFVLFAPTSLFLFYFIFFFFVKNVSSIQAFLQRPLCRPIFRHIFALRRCMHLRLFNFQPFYFASSEWKVYEITLFFPFSTLVTKASYLPSFSL